MGPVAIGLLDAQRIERVVAAVREAVGGAGCDQRIVDRNSEPAWDVQLIAELADVSQAQSKQALVSDVQFAAGCERKGAVAHVLAGQ